MELLQLKYFCAAASCESFSATAKHYNVPPSDISQSIRRLENELGLKLFERSANRIRLNENGHKLYAYFSRALDVIADGISSVTERDGGRLNICINANRRIVMKVVECLQASEPDITVTAKSFCDPCAEKFDVIVSAKDSRLDGYESVLLLQEPVSIAMRRDSAHINITDLSKLANEPFVSMNEQSSQSRLTLSVCSDFGFVPRVAVQSDDPYYVRRCVELGLGYAIVPEITWRGQFSDLIVLKRIDGYTRDTFLYTARDRYASPQARLFVEMLVAECEREGEYIK